ncbi:MAG: hypothetical protein NUV53_02325 [Patescibacteria group bacterium]|nr:hypothetical protein [Patescibacteria group bacterium]
MNDTALRNEKVKFIQEGNGIREQSITVLTDLQSFRPKNSRKDRLKIEEFEIKSSALDKEFLDYDKRAGLFSETLAMAITVDEKSNSVRTPTLEEHTLLSIHASHLSAQRETLRNLLYDIKEKINNKRDTLSTQTAEKNSLISLRIATLSVVIAIIGIFSTLHSINIANQQLKVEMEANELGKTSLQLAVDPQIDIFLERTEGEKIGNFFVGIENNGVVPIVNLSGYASIFTMNKNEYNIESARRTRGGSTLLFDTTNLTSSTSTKALLSLLVEQNPNMVKIIVLNISYQRKIDNKEYNIQPIFLLDNYKTYTFKNLKNMEALGIPYKKIIDLLGIWNLKPDYKVYWPTNPY